MSIPTVINTWQMVKPGEFQRTEIPLPALTKDTALVQVAGCGVCHTDLGYFFDGVPTKNPPPLTLGHEISGTVVSGPEYLVGKNVIVPAVMPCGECPICHQARGNRCLSQKMPGNSLGIYGGFSDFIPVPAQDFGRIPVSLYDLCVIDDLRGIPLSHYAVVADAVTTPFQATTRAELRKDDLVIVIGACGGVGTYMTQIAKALGAKVVVAIDVQAEKLEMMRQFGADNVIDASGKDPKAIRDEFKKICEKAGVPNNFGWKIFEASGTKAGQEIALALHGFISTLVIIGYTTAKVEYMLSMEMYHDSQIIGTWGCLPGHYPKVLQMVQSGKIQIEPFVETKPMSQIAEVFQKQHEVGFPRRQVLIPDF